jgi:NAD(P)-dependent dehydrogenase (short-subunit alcohol dehydrogenase family)
MLNKSSAHYPSLQDRRVLITGGATGIGAAMVEAFAKQGAQVGFIDIDETSAQTLIHSLQEVRHRPAFVRADLTVIAELQAAIQQLRAQLGLFQVLVNNAANDQRHHIEDTTPELWDAGIAVNIRHQFFAAQCVGEDFKAQGGGAIINMGSIAWHIKLENAPLYNLSKAAVEGFTRSLAADWGAHGIRVNAILPGAVLTEKQLRLWVSEEDLLHIHQRQCLKQNLQAHHVADMALFLAADDSAMCTAQHFVVDAGFL